MNSAPDFDWNELAFGNKKTINNLKAVFIAAPRELSAARFTQLIKTYLPQGNIVLGLAKEAYVQGLEKQPQFKMLSLETVQNSIASVNAAGLKHRIYTLAYFQRDLRYLLEKLDFQKAVFVNGSWYHSFHLRSEYYILANRQVPYELVSPFASEGEARRYAAERPGSVAVPAVKGLLSAADMLKLANQVAKNSFDYSFQIGVALGLRQGKAYRLLAAAHNPVVPFETFAMHHGASREIHFSPAQDLNYYDTIHAEVALLIKVQKEKLELHDTTLFINLLPCPTCARMLAQTDIAELVYSLDHSDGYAAKMLVAAGKKVRRIVP